MATVIETADTASEGSAPSVGSPDQDGSTLLCVANFPTNTGFAWDFIERLYVEAAAHAARHGMRTLVAYPEVREVPRSLAASVASAAELAWDLDSLRGVIAVLGFVRRNRVRILYLTDRPLWHPAYALLRLAGVRWIMVHDHTSGARTRPEGVKRLLKGFRMKVRPMRADVAIGVSDFVTTRLREVGLFPAEGVHRIWNWVDIPEVEESARQRLRSTFGLEDDRPVIVCTCRAVPEKGVEYLFRAFERMDRERLGHSPVLVYFGDGPGMTGLRELRESLVHKDDIILAGYRREARRLSEGADVGVAPSVWEEAFGLSVLEPMASGVAVVATAVGGIPEIVEDGVTGLLVPPRDEEALAGALERLLENVDLRTALADRGRMHARSHFSGSNQLTMLRELLTAGMAKSR